MKPTIFNLLEQTNLCIIFILSIISIFKVFTENI